MMKQPLKSKLIDGVAYDETSHRLLLFMVNGQRREYIDVPPHVYEDLLATKSPGTYYTKLIRLKFAPAESAK